MAILFGDGREIASVKDFLCAKPPNTLYTTMRLSGKTGEVSEFEMHMSRLKVEADQTGQIKEMLRQVHQVDKDLRVTLVRNSDSFDLIYEEMPNFDRIDACQVEIKLGHRENVQEKTSQWVKDRRRLEESKLPESNEIILSDRFGRLYEGLSSNFFILRSDGRLQTAPLDQVLPGTVMKRVLELEGDDNLVFENPKIEEIDTWKGAFITSTSRLILPIDKIVIFNEESEIIASKAIPLNDKITQLRQDIK